MRSSACERWREACFRGCKLRLGLRCDILVAGYPCVDLSGLNNHAASFDDKSGKTGGAQQAIIHYISKTRPQALLFENVAGIVQNRAQNAARPIDQQDKQLRALGYRGAWAFLDAKHFALPQSRPRVYMW